MKKYEKPVLISLDDLTCNEGICITGGGTSTETMN